MSHNLSKLYQSVMGVINSSDASTTKENANKDAKLIPTQRDLVAGVVAKAVALDEILPKHVANAHVSGDIHFHDLDYSPLFPMFNCMLINYENMLKYGFKMGSADIDTPKSITTACAVTAQIVASVASNIYGGNTLSRIDEILAPYVTASAKKHHDRGERYGLSAAQLERYVQECTEKECYDAFQALEYEINTLQTSNGQTPFCTINFGLGTSWESKLIQEAILKNRIRGLGKNGETPAFPKLVYTIKKGVNFYPNDPNYNIKKLALECSVKRMYPDILNYDKVVEVTGDFKPPMGCRSFLGSYHDEQGNPETLGRNNLGVVTVNLPRIAIRASGSVETFYRLLDEQLQICFDALMLRIERLKTVKAKTAPILYTEGACGVRLDPEDYVIDIFKNGRASISLGYIGIHETICSLFNTNKVIGEYEREALKIVTYLRSTVERWKKETSWGFSLYSTPAESLCYRFCRLDREQYGEIENVTDKEYYTNSFHLDVREKVTPFDKIEFEMGYPSAASGGFITFWESNSLRDNPEALETVWDFTYDRVPYFASNFPTDKCFECGYDGEFTASVDGYCCPKCGNNNPERMDVTRRVCGYLGKAGRPFNHGKQIEVTKRIKHM